MAFSSAASCARSSSSLRGGRLMRVFASSTALERIWSLSSQMRSARSRRSRLYCRSPSPSPSGKASAAACMSFFVARNSGIRMLGAMLFAWVRAVRRTSPSGRQSR
nr:hypothetical protein ISGA_05965 [Gordonia sp. NB41Y]